MSVKRYDLELQVFASEYDMVESDNGDYVAYEDYAILKAERDALRAVAWADGYSAGVADERTSAANIGIAGFGGKIEPARGNPYLSNNYPPKPVAQDSEPSCNPHPDAPHGFNRSASLSEDRSVCDCEYWVAPEPPQLIADDVSDDVSDEVAEVIKRYLPFTSFVDTRLLARKIAGAAINKYNEEVK